MSNHDLEHLYREQLEESIIFCLASRRKIPEERAIQLYYSSKLADRIHEGQYGIQYLDYHVLTDYLEDEIHSQI